MKPSQPSIKLARRGCFRARAAHGFGMPIEHYLVIHQEATASAHDTRGLSDVHR